MLLRFLVVVSSLFVFAACSTTQNKSADLSATNAAAEKHTTTSRNIAVFEPIEGSKTGARSSDRVFFGYDSSVLTVEAQQTLDRQALWLRDNPGVKASVEGHCDERGTREYNLALGERRANAAKNYLVAAGVPASRLSVISYGKERPAVLGSTPAAWAENRRAVTVINP